MRGTTFRMLVGSVLLAAGLVLAIEWRAAQTPISAGFWFDGDAFDSPMLAGEWGGPLRADEFQRIDAVAWDELRHGFAGMRLGLTRDDDAFFKVRVVPAPGADRRRSRLSGESRPMGPLGGQGVVYFQTLAGLAVSLAPPGTGRDAVVDAIGRGIGRAAVHEFAHQLLPRVDLHEGADEASYESGRADRVELFYGDARWAFAADLVRERLRGQGLSFTPR